MSLRMRKAGPQFLYISIAIASRLSWVRSRQLPTVSSLDSSTEYHGVGWFLFSNTFINSIING